MRRPSRLRPSTALPHPSLPQAPDSVALAQLDRSAAGDPAGAQADRTAAARPRPARARRPAGLPTLALAPRATPYTLAELRRLAPAVFADVPGVPGALLLGAHLEVPVGATLVIDARTPDVRLPSAPVRVRHDHFPWHDDVAGTAQTPVRISTWDPQLRGPDGDLHRRPLVRAADRRPDGRRPRAVRVPGLRHGHQLRRRLARRRPDVAEQPERWIKAQGTVTSSVFAHNHFGAYTHEAQGMRWSGNTFSDNEEYGFDPHDFSNDFVVESNTAHHNGKHGFIFSRGCVRNVLRGNTAYANAGHGFMIDDGRSVASATAEARIDPRTTTSSPATSPTTTPAAASRSRAVPATWWPTTTCRATTSGCASRTAPRPRSPATRSTTASATGCNVLDTGGPGGDRRQPHLRLVGGGQPRRGEQRDAGREPVDRRLDTLVIGGVAQRDPSWIERMGQFLRWNPVLVLWALTLGVPLLVGLWRFVRAPAAPATATRCTDVMTRAHGRWATRSVLLLAGLALLLAGCATAPRPDAPRRHAGHRPATLAGRRARGRSGPCPRPPSR